MCFGTSMSDSSELGTLYVVATPIGNLGDLTRRAENVLSSVEIVAAEDTRRTSVLLDHIGHRVPHLLSYHEHNKKRMTADLLERLKLGHDVALVSDAGTPLVNDPGAEPRPVIGRALHITPQVGERLVAEADQFGLHRVRHQLIHCPPSTL